MSMINWMKYFSLGQKAEESIALWDQIEDLDDGTIGQIALDILETQDEMILLTPIGGIDLADIDLSYNQSILTIKGMRAKPEMYYHEVEIRNQECHWGRFERNVILPEYLDFDTIRASLENNLLIITIGKLEFPSQNIKINKIEG